MDDFRFRLPIKLTEDVKLAFGNHPSDEQCELEISLAALLGALPVSSSGE